MKPFLPSSRVVAADALKLNIKSPCDLKVLVSVLKEKPLTQGAVIDPKNVSEFSPINLSFTTLKVWTAKQEREARRASSCNTRELSSDPLSADNSLRDGTRCGGSVSGGVLDATSSMTSTIETPDTSSGSHARGAGAARLRSAANEIMAGFGNSDERRSKAVFGSAEEAMKAAVAEMSKGALRKVARA